MKRIAMRPILVLLLPLLLGACAPAAVTVASLAASGLSYVTTGKSVSDHTLSAMVNKDCALLRVIAGEPLCRDQAPSAFAPQPTLLAHASSSPGFSVSPVFSSATTSPASSAATRLASRMPAPGPDPTAAELAAIAPAAGPAPAGPTPAGPVAGPEQDSGYAGDGLFLLRKGGGAFEAAAETLASGTAVLEGFAPGTELFALVQDDGALEVFTYDPARADAGTAGAPGLDLVLRIDGYAGDPDCFAGLWLNGTFHFVGNIAV